MQKIGSIPVLCFDPLSIKIAQQLDEHICNTLSVSQWVGTDGRGNCFFSSVDMFMRLYAYNHICELKTGIFSHDSESVFHAWIELSFEDEIFVLNVSNLHTKPAYIIKKAEYYSINNIQKILQTIDFKKMKFHIQTYQKNKGSDSVRDFTKFLLKPTLRHLKRYFKNTQQS